MGSFRLQRRILQPERYYNPAIWSKMKFEDCGNLTKDDIRFFSENIYSLFVAVNEGFK